MLLWSHCQPKDVEKLHVFGQIVIKMNSNKKILQDDYEDIGMRYDRDAFRARAVQ